MDMKQREVRCIELAQAAAEYSLLLKKWLETDDKEIGKEAMEKNCKLKELQKAYDDDLYGKK